MTKMTERLVARQINAGKGKTFAQAQDDILALLKAKGWETKLGLKVPHATSPTGKLRLWFKTQAVYFTAIGDESLGEPIARHPLDGPAPTKHDFKDARTISYSLDIRQMDGAAFLAYVSRLFRTI